MVFSLTEDKDNVNGNDALEMLRSYIEDKTNCIVASSIDEADFIIELLVIKKAMADRSAKIELKHILSDEVVFETDWVRGASTAFYGFSGSKAANGKIIKKYLLKAYPKIEMEE